nr:60S acidic ribosomal protein P2A-like [Tanacetum cinerariifolium]
MLSACSTPGFSETIFTNEEASPNAHAKSYFSAVKCCSSAAVPNFFHVGADADEDRIALLLSEVKGKDITELIASGREKLASVPSGGGVAVAAAGGGAAPAAAEAESKKEEKVEEKEESDEEMGFSLFDD